jgi:hypothetical protein
LEEVRRRWCSSSSADRRSSTVSSLLFCSCTSVEIWPMSPFLSDCQSCVWRASRTFRLAWCTRAGFRDDALALGESAERCIGTSLGPGGHSRHKAWTRYSAPWRLYIYRRRVRHSGCAFGHSFACR